MPPLPSWPGGGASKPVIPFIAAVIAIGVGALVWSQFRQVQQLERQLQLVQRQITQLESQNQDLTRNKTALEGQLKMSDERLAELRHQVTAATESLEDSRQDLGAMQDRYEEIAESRATMESQLASVTGERDEARRRTERLDTENEELERSVVRLRERLALLERDFRQAADQLARLEAVPHAGVSVVTASGPTSTVLPSVGAKGTVPSLSAGTVELPPILVRKDHAGMSMPVRGRIVEVNDPHQFIVVDKGSLDGVRIGMVLEVVRGTANVGRATVVRLRPKLSACDLVRSKTPGPLQVGDEVIQHGSGAP